MDAAPASSLVVRIPQLRWRDSFHRNHQRVRAEISRIGWQHRPHVESHRGISTRPPDDDRRHLFWTCIARRPNIYTSRGADHRTEERRAHARDARYAGAPLTESLEISSPKHQLAVDLAPLLRRPAVHVPRLAAPRAREPSARYPPRWFSNGASSRISARTSRRTPHS